MDVIDATRKSRPENLLTETERINAERKFCTRLRFTQLYVNTYSNWDLRLSPLRLTRVRPSSVNLLFC